ncbi:MAG TPA: oligosaccharide flippase family protein [Anaerolineales bacterium]|nr:oligosaccharide flippase family protein [Anaerolineales bacterium]
MVDAPSRLTKNSLWMIFSRIAAQGLAVVFTILLARRLGIAEFGGYAFIAAVLFVANALTTFGTDMLLIREIAANHDLSGLPASLLIQLLLSALLILLIWAFAGWLPNQDVETITALKVYSLALIPLAFFTVCTTALRGKQLMDIYALVNVIVSLLQVGVVIVLREGSLVLLSVLLVLLHLLAALVAGILCTVTIPNFWSPWRLFSFPFFSLLRAAAPIAMLTLITMFYQRLSIMSLTLMSGPTDTGIFSAAARVVEGSKTLHLAIFAALYPVMASGGPLRSHPFAGGYLKPLMTGAVLICLLLFMFASPLVRLLYGDPFMSSSHLLRILSWTLIPFTINTYLTLSFLAARQEPLIGRALLVSLIALFFLSIKWIPSFGAQGAAWALLASESLQAGILLVAAFSRPFVKGASHEFSNLP